MIHESKCEIDEFLDKEIRHILSKEYVYPYTLDLHGFRYREGEEAAFEFIRLHQNSPIKQLTIITGHSGIMYKKFPIWFIKKFSQYAKYYKTFYGHYKVIMK